MENSNLKVAGILEENRERVILTIEKLYKKADKLNVPRPTVIFREKYVKTVFGEPNEFLEEKIYEYDLFDISINLEQSMKLGGWSPIAFIDHVDKVHIQMNIDADYNYDFLKAIDDCGCDHCKVDRFRRKSWVLKNDTNNFKKVGSSCVKDFTGVNPKSFFKMFQLSLDTISDFIGSEDMCYGGRGFHRNTENYRVYDIDRVWTVAKNIIDIDKKYIKNEWSNPENRRERPVRTNLGESTSDKLFSIIEGTDENNPYYSPLNYIDHELVSDMRTWLNSLVVRQEKRTRFVYDENGNEIYGEDGHEIEEEYFVDNEYDAKLKEWTDKKRTRRFDIGFLSYMIVPYMEYVKLKNAPISEYVGVVGEKSPLNLTLVSMKDFETQFGTSTIYKLSDDNNNIFIKFGTISQKFVKDNGNLEVGCKLSFLAEIKNHSEYQNVKQTTIGRISNIPVEKVKKNKKSDI